MTYRPPAPYHALGSLETALGVVEWDAQVARNAARHNPYPGFKARDEALAEQREQIAADIRAAIAQRDLQVAA